MKDIDPLKKTSRYTRRDRMLGAVGFIASIQLVAGLAVAMNGSSGDARPELIAAFERSQTYKFKGEMSYTADGRRVTMAMEGRTDEARDITEQTVRYTSTGPGMPSGSQTTLSVKGVTYIKAGGPMSALYDPPPGKRWIRWEFGAAAKDMDEFADPDESELAKDVRFAGTEDFRGRSVRHLTAKLDYGSLYRRMYAKYANKSASSPEPIPQVASRMDVYIYSSGYIVWMRTITHVREGKDSKTSEMTLEMFDHGRSVGLAAPKAGDVFVFDPMASIGGPSSGRFSGSMSSGSKQSCVTDASGGTTCSSSSTSSGSHGPFSNPWAIP